MEDGAFPSSTSSSKMLCKASGPLLVHFSLSHGLIRVRDEPKANLLRPMALPLQVDNFSWIINWVLSFEKEATVIGPLSLRNKPVDPDGSVRPFSKRRKNYPKVTYSCQCHLMDLRGSD
jgi:hypothetical protein